MSMTDPIADLLSTIRNGQAARLSYVTTPSSKLKSGVLDVLKREGYIEGYEEIDRSDEKAKKKGKGTAKKGLRVHLRYAEGAAVIRELVRVSKPGRRVYKAVADLENFYSGLGIGVLSTPAGVLSDHEARQKNVGGEIMCKVF